MGAGPSWGALGLNRALPPWAARRGRLEKGPWELEAELLVCRVLAQTRRAKSGTLSDFTPFVGMRTPPPPRLSHRFFALLSLHPRQARSWSCSPEELPS